MEDQSIIDEIRHGDLKNLGELYVAYRHTFILWLQHHYGCDPLEAREIYQASILILHDNIRKGMLNHSDGNLKTYLFGIGKNKLHEWRREQIKVTKLVAPDLLELPSWTDIEAKEREKRLRRMEDCLDRLGDPCRRLLRLYYKEGLSMKDIAERLGYKNSETAKSQKCKCIARLRKLYRESSTKKHHRN